MGLQGFAAKRAPAKDKGFARPPSNNVCYTARSAVRSVHRFCLLTFVCSSLAAACSESSQRRVLEGQGQGPSRSEATAQPTTPAAPTESAAIARVNASAAPSSSVAAAPIASATAQAPHEKGAAEPPPRPPGARLYSRARFAWIQQHPRPSKGWIGYLGLGDSVRLRGGSVEKARVWGPGCDVWYAVEPMGFVCADAGATIDENDPIVRAVAEDRPKLESPWPYDYAESIGAPRYKEIPTVMEQHKAEWDLDQHLGLVKKARAGDVGKDLIGVDLTAAGTSPPPLVKVSPLIREARPFIAPGSTVAYSRSFDADGRTYVLAHDRALLPKDRLKPYPRSPFHGVELGKDASLPLAFFRRKDRPQYTRDAGGSFTKTADVWPRLSFVELTGKEEKRGKDTFLETKDRGRWVHADDAVVPVASTPPSDKRDDVTGPKAGRRTWLEVSVLGGWMLAYEGSKPIFATLMSPGRGGIPYEGVDAIETASTPTGTFRVDGKFTTATMVSSTNELIVHTEVQFVQNFHGPHALHGAYWHDVWGELKSGGCVNLSPMDAKRIFEWTEPTLPEGWHGMRSIDEFGPATSVVIHR